MYHVAARRKTDRQSPWRWDALAERGFWPITAVVLLILAGVQVGSIRLESQTMDEGAHLVSGYSYWQTRDFRLNPEHPPLSKLLAALPVAALHPELKLDPQRWGDADEFGLGKDFLYRNRVPADTMLFAARAVTIAWTLLLAIVLAYWCRSRFGAAAGLLALLLCAFDPTVIAHGRYITSDIPVTFLMFAACLSFIGALEKPARGPLIRTGLLTGLALGCKFNAIVLYAAFALIALAKHRYGQRAPLEPITRAGENAGPAPTPRPRRSSWTVALVVVPSLVVWSLYFFDTRSLAGDPRLAQHLATRQPGPLGRALQQAPIPAYYFFRGMHLLYRHAHAGHRAYLLGVERDHGTPLYFPIAFAVKTPIATLSLLLLAALLALRRVRRCGLLALPFPAAALLLFGALYGVTSLASPLNIGIRHILPIMPALFVAIAATLFAGGQARWTVPVRCATVALALGLVFESLSAYPNYTPFFNAAAGGPVAGPRYLLDSNLDWGQDLKKLKAWDDGHGSAPLCLTYFGNAEPAYYGIFSQTPEPAAAPYLRDTCYVVVSAHYLFGDERLAPLRALDPIARVGGSIYVFPRKGASGRTADNAEKNENASSRPLR